MLFIMVWKVPKIIVLVSIMTLFMDIWNVDAGDRGN